MDADNQTTVVDPQTYYYRSQTFLDIIKYYDILD